MPGPCEKILSTLKSSSGMLILCENKGPHCKDSKVAHRRYHKTNAHKEHKQMEANDANMLK